MWIFESSHRNCHPRSLRKQPTFCDTNTSFRTKWCLRGAGKNPYWWHITTQILVVLLIGWNKFSLDTTNQRHYPLPDADLMMCHQYGISVVISQTSFRRETSGDILKCRPFSQGTTQEEGALLYLWVTFLAVAMFTFACKFPLLYCLWRKWGTAPSLFGNGLLFKFHRWKGKPARYMVEFKKNRFTIGNDHQFNTLSDLIEVWNDWKIKNAVD